MHTHAQVRHLRARIPHTHAQAQHLRVCVPQGACPVERSDGDGGGRVDVGRPVRRRVVVVGIIARGGDEQRPAGRHRAHSRLCVQTRHPSGAGP